MVSPRRKSTNQHNKLFYFTLLFMWIVNVRATEIQVQAEVGGNVTIYCPVDPQRKITYFYFQKPKPLATEKDDFVNGFHSENNIPDKMKWNNTRLDPHNKTTVHMYNVTLKHAGVYKCHIDGIPVTTVNLTVTAKYSKPEVTKTNISRLGLCVTCKSYGGYPPALFMWNVSGNEEWRVTGINTKADKLTELINTSSTVFINCSGVERSVSCSVGDSTLETVQVCQPTPPRNVTWIIVCCVLGSFGLVLLVLLVLLVVWIIKKKEKDSGCGGDGGDGGEGGDGGRQTQNAQEMEPLNTKGNGNA